MLFIDTSSANRVFLGRHKMSLKQKCDFLASCPCLRVRFNVPVMHCMQSGWLELSWFVCPLCPTCCAWPLPVLPQHLTPAEVETISRVFEYHTFYPGSVIAREGDFVDPMRCVPLSASLACSLFWRDICRQSSVCRPDCEHPTMAICCSSSISSKCRSLVLLARGEVSVVVKQPPTRFQLHQRQSKFVKGVRKAVSSTGMTEQQLLDPWCEAGDS